ncbi:hypothetical protein EC988_007692, partial [Linderina pennispora]
MNSKKNGGRVRPAPLVLMYAPADPSDSPVAENRSLSLLTVDTHNEYLDPDLHRQRVRCVLDGIESRGLIYRARRMQARLDHHLATSRERYIRVYRARMNRLLETGLFHPSDMQSIRAYLYTLETGEDDTPISHAPVAMRRSVFENGQLRQKVSLSDVEDALIHFKTKFAMPTEMVESSEFRAFCRAMFQAQRDGSLTTPFYTTPDAYMSRVGLVADKGRKTLYQRLASAERYSVLLGASSSGRYIGISVSVQQQRHFLGWAENSDITSVAAQRVIAMLAELEHGIDGVGAETKPVLFSIISAGPPWLSEIRQAAARAFL